MLDPNFVRQNIQKIQHLVDLGRGDKEKVNLAKWQALDVKRSELIQKSELIRAERNKINAGLNGKPDYATIEKMSDLKKSLELIEADLNVIESEWQEILDWMPNIPLDDVPQGTTSKDNVEIKAWSKDHGYFDHADLGLAEKSGKKMSNFGSNRDTDFEPKPHWEIGEKLGLINLEAGAKVSGSRFYYIVGDGAKLIMASFNLLMQKLLDEGFTPMIVPTLVREIALYGSSHFPGDADQIYKLENKYLEDENALYLVGSSEPSNFAYFANQTLDLSNPIKVTAQTACFRSEVGSWGKDVRGIKRTHQFEKIEMNVVMEADLDKAKEMHEYLLSINEWLLQQLEIPYHVINMCYGDLGYYAAAKKYDIEFWTPSQKTYTELMSNSITTDYQSRRLGIKYKDEDGNLKYAYTLNDTGITHRILIAIIEHYQQSDGSIKVPEVLRQFVGKDFIGR